MRPVAASRARPVGRRSCPSPITPTGVPSRASRATKASSASATSSSPFAARATPTGETKFAHAFRAVPHIEAPGLLVEHEHRLAAGVGDEDAARFVDHAADRPLQHDRALVPAVEAGQPAQEGRRARSRRIVDLEVLFARQHAGIGVARHFGRRRPQQPRALGRRLHAELEPRAHRIGGAGGQQQRGGGEHGAGGAHHHFPGPDVP